MDGGRLVKDDGQTHHHTWARWKRVADKTLALAKKRPSHWISRSSRLNSRLVKSTYYVI